MQIKCHFYHSLFLQQAVLASLDEEDILKTDAALKKIRAVRHLVERDADDALVGPYSFRHHNLIIEKKNATNLFEWGVDW